MEKFDSSKFKNGASYLISDEAYKQYVKGAKGLGREDTENGNLFCSPKDEIDKAIANSNGDINRLEAELGLDKRSLGDGPIHRVDIINPSKHNLREATGYESGANCFFNTPRDENGKTPNIVFCKQADEKGTWTARDSSGREIIDADKTDANEIAKLNGRYVTNHGDVHEPNTEGYKHTTSGGVYEGVTDNVPNTSENVNHSIISGWGKGQEGNLCTSKDNSAYPGKLTDLTHDDINNISGQRIPQTKQADQTQNDQSQSGRGQDGHYQSNQDQNSIKDKSSSGMPTKSTDLQQINSATERQGSSDGISSTAADGLSQSSGQGSSVGMPTTATGKSSSVSDSSSVAQEKGFDGMSM